MQLDINKLIQPTEAYVPESSDPIVQPYTYIYPKPLAIIKMLELGFTCI